MLDAQIDTNMNKIMKVGESDKLRVSAIDS